MRQNIPLLQHTKCSPTNNTPLYKITSSAKQVICARFHGCKNENFNHICSSVRMLQNVAHWTDILQWNFILKTYEDIKKIRVC